MAAFFHSDDMALAAYEVMKAHGRTSILIGGVDAMPPAIDAVLEGRVFATVRNPSCLIHGGAVVAGVAAVTAAGNGGTGVPRRVVTNGPVVTVQNADGVRWMENQFLMCPAGNLSFFSQRSGFPSVPTPNARAPYLGR